MDAPTDPPKDILHIECIEASVFKSMSEFYKATVPIVILRIGKRGITCNVDNKKIQKDKDGDEHTVPETLLSVLNLPRAHFVKYSIPQTLENDEDANVPIIMEASNFASACSGILKGDKFVMSIKSDDPYKLQCDISNPDKGRRMRETISLLKEDNALVIPRLSPASPCNYDRDFPTAVAPAREFQKVCKANSQVKAVLVNVQAQTVKSMDGVEPRSGVKLILSKLETEKSFYFGDFREDQAITYSADFLIKGNFAPLQKCCCLSNSVKIYCGEGKVMLISLEAGRSGSIDVYYVPN